MAQAGTRHPRTRDVKKNPRAGGRPSSYRSEFAGQALNYCLLGATDKQLADFFNVSESTLNLWKQKHARFSESIKRGKTVADAQVAASLFKRAIGFAKRAVKIFQHNGGSYEHEFDEYYPPETTAQIFWLKNRCPEQWRDRHQHEHSGPNGEPIQVEEMSAEQIERELAKSGALPPSGK